MQTTLRPVGESTRWNEFKLEDVLVDIQPGFARRPSDSGDVAHLRTNNISPEGKLDLSQLKHVKASKNEIEKYSLVKGDVLFNNTNSDIWVGKTAFVYQNLKALYSNHLTRLRVDKSRVDAQFLAIYLHKLQEEGFFKAISTRWVNQTAVNTTAMRRLKLRIPSIEYQRAVVVLLNKVEVVKELREQANRLTSKIIQSVFLKMFGDPARNPMGWDTAKLTELVRIVGGGTPSTGNPLYWKGPIPWVSPKDMKWSIIEDSIDHVSQEAIAAGKTKLIPKESVLVVIRSGILKKHLPIAINSVSVAINQDLKALLPRVRIDPYFLLFHLKTLSKDLLKMVKGTTADNISTVTLREMQVMIPPLQLQERFSNFAKMTFKVSDRQALSANEINELFHSLLHKAFRGELAVAKITM
jgi:restriction endonuclease S subunit